MSVQGSITLITYDYVGGHYPSAVPTRYHAHVGLDDAAAQALNRRRLVLRIAPSDIPSAKWEASYLGNYSATGKTRDEAVAGVVALMTGLEVTA
jgi:hypothetical protein